MSYSWDGGSIFGNTNGDAVFGGGGGGGNVATQTGNYSTGNGWADRLFNTGQDIFSQFLDVKKDQWLIDERTKLLQAQNQQMKMLGTVEQPVQTNAQTLEPWQIAALQQSQSTASNQKLLMWVLVAAVAYTALK